MAYTIISQNNSTTTLSDGVNTITVPSRVNLTSGNFTIVEVNNNMATLEDGDGNVYRDIPCVATLAGEGGGGGSGLPDQTGQSGKFLTTDGTDASWSDKPLVNTATGSSGLGILGTTSAIAAVVIGDGSQTTYGAQQVVVGSGAQGTGNRAVAIGLQASGYNDAVAIGGYTSAASNGIAIGRGAQATGTGTCQICINGSGATNSDANTVKIANNNGNYELLSADGTIPSDRLVHAINKYSTMPTAAAGNVGWIVQFTGTTDSTYTHGHLYECVSDGQDPATYSWTEVSMGGGSSYTAGTGINIDANNEISVTAPVAQLVQVPGYNGTSVYGLWANTSITSHANNIVLGYNASTNSSASSGCAAIGSNTVVGSGCIAVGGDAKAPGTDCIAIGNGAKTGQYLSNAIQFGYGTNSTAGTLQVWSYTLLNKSDGTIPTARLTKVNSTITLTAAGWSGGSQTVTVTGMTATGVVLVSPDPTDQSAYTSAGIICTAQAADSLTFTCSTTPSADIDVNVVML